ncbi:MAG: hypothetical protein CMJ89_07625 [Planctomycetes bacterium]|nr:hypothetical protein [Planctomycetota bacterium]
MGFARMPRETAAVSLISWFESESHLEMWPSNSDSPDSLSASPIFAMAIRQPVTMSLFVSFSSAVRSAGTTLLRICSGVGRRLSLALLFSPCPRKNPSLPVCLPAS